MERFFSLFQKYGNNFGLESFFMFFATFKHLINMIKSI